MSERAFHMTPAEAEILRELAAGDVIKYLPVSGLHLLFKSRRHVGQATLGALLRQGWARPVERTFGADVAITDAGREALRQYEEGQT